MAECPWNRSILCLVVDQMNCDVIPLIIIASTFEHTRVQQTAFC